MMKRAISVLLITVAALVAVATATSGLLLALADGGRGGELGDRSEESDTRSGPFNNTNVRGSQQNQQGSNNVQTDDDTGGLIGDVPDSRQQNQQGSDNVQRDHDTGGGN